MAHSWVMYHGGDEPLADSESIDASALVYDGGYGVLVEAVGGHDLAVLQTGGVQHLPDLLGQIRKVAGVETDTPEALPHRFEDLLGAADGVGGSRPEDVVGVDEQDGSRRIQAGVAGERLVLGIVVHHPAVGHRTAYRYSEHLAREDGGAPCRASDVRGSRSVHGGIHVVCPSRSEIGDGTVLGGPDDA